MMTKKITLSELRSIVKQIIKEELELNEGIHDMVILSSSRSNREVNYKEEQKNSLVLTLMYVLKLSYQ